MLRKKKRSDLFEAIFFHALKFGLPTLGFIIPLKIDPFCRRQ